MKNESDNKVLRDELNTILRGAIVELARLGVI